MKNIVPQVIKLTQIYLLVGHVKRLLTVVSIRIVKNMVCVYQLLVLAMNVEMTLPVKKFGLEFYLSVLNVVRRAQRRERVFQL